MGRKVVGWHCEATDWAINVVLAMQPHMMNTHMLLLCTTRCCIVDLPPLQPCQPLFVDTPQAKSNVSKIEQLSTFKCSFCMQLIVISDLLKTKEPLVMNGAKLHSIYGQPGNAVHLLGP